MRYQLREQSHLHPWRKGKPYDAVLAKALAALQAAGLTCELQSEQRRVEL